MRHLYTVVLKLTAIAIWTLVTMKCQSQLSIPYSTSFETDPDTAYWTHYGLTSGDDWEYGMPSKTNIASAHSGLNAWVTDLDTGVGSAMNRALQTPFFDFTNLSENYGLGFYHNRKGTAGYAFRVEYTTDGGQSWNILIDPGSFAFNWQTTSGFSTSTCCGYEYSRIELDFLQGLPEVAFRFRLNNVTAGLDGWAIDDFSIAEDVIDLSANISPYVEVAEYCSTLDLGATINLNNVSGLDATFQVDVYLSTDPFLDLDDSITFSIYMNASDTMILGPQSMNSLYPAGLYYAFLALDKNNEIPELDESNNLVPTQVYVASAAGLPFVEDFENATTGSWGFNGNWAIGTGNSLGGGKAHSGNHAMFNDFALIPGQDELYSPYLNLQSDTGQIVVQFWTNTTPDVIPQVFMDYNCVSNTILPGDQEDLIPWDSWWDYRTVDITEYADYGDVRFRIKDFGGNTDGGATGCSIDDFYVGRWQSDLSIERDKENYFTASQETSVEMLYELTNSGKAVLEETTTRFYWSLDSISGPDDILLGTKIEDSIMQFQRTMSSFTFLKPDLALNEFYILYELDFLEEIPEMREYNNHGWIHYNQLPLFTAPYFNDFETEEIGWSHNASLGTDLWIRGIPAKSDLDTAFSGNHVFITDESEVLPPTSRMHLYTPIFDFTNMSNPVLTFDMKGGTKYFASQVENYLTTCMNMEFSVNGGATWITLEPMDANFIRWYAQKELSNGIDYNTNEFTCELFGHPNSPVFADTWQYNGRNTTRNTRYGLLVANLAGSANVRFRFNVASATPSSGELFSEGFMIDNFRIEEAMINLEVPYTRALMLSGNSQEFYLDMDIMNSGNALAGSSVASFYLSADDVLDGSDYVLGNKTIDSIAADTWNDRYHTFLNIPLLNQYHYLIYVLDSEDALIETNEGDNMGAWPLALDSVHVYPYINQFEDMHVDGWHPHIRFDDPNLDLNQYLIRNYQVPADKYHDYVPSGIWFTENLSSSNMNELPFFELDSPDFDFGAYDSLSIQFDLQCRGNTFSIVQFGGALNYSINGGNGWQLLTADSGSALNWYNDAMLNQLGSAGWAYNSMEQFHPEMDISFLKGEEDVRFKFIYRQPGLAEGYGLNGFTMDNFMIEAFEVDFVAIDSMTIVSAAAADEELSVDCHYFNSGQSAGIAGSTTKFYWSSDAVFDESDPMVFESAISHIESGTVFTESLVIPFSGPIIQSNYYLFYRLDETNNLLESNESNNIGSFVVDFGQVCNYHPLNQPDSIYAFVSEPTFDLTYSIVNNQWGMGSTTVTEFFWSEDGLMLGDDLSIGIYYDPAIAPGDTLDSTITIHYPQPIQQEMYYLFYLADRFNNLNESNESDNRGFFKVYFDFIENVEEVSNGAISVYSTDHELIVDIPSTLTGGSFDLKWFSDLGNCISTQKVSLNVGRNALELPANLASGMYFIHVLNEKHSATAKLIIRR